MSLEHILSESNVFTDTESLTLEDAKVRIFYAEEALWHGSHFAHLGFIQWSENEVVNKELVGRSVHWAQKFKVPLLLGPIDGTTMFNYRYRLDHFGDSLFDGEPANSDLEVNRLKNFGFNVIERYQTVVIHDISSVQGYWSNWCNRHSKLEFKPLDFELWQMELDRLPQLVDSVFSDNPGYIPLPHTLLKKIFGRNFFEKLCLKTSRFVYLNQELVGFSFNYADNGSVFVKSAGLAPVARFRGLGFIALVTEIIQSMDAHHDLVACLMRENNFPDRLLRKEALKRISYGLFAKNVEC